MNFFEFSEILSNYSAQKFAFDLSDSLEYNENAIQLQKDQWQKGQDCEGLLLGKYSKYTQRINPLKVAGTPYTLFDTGNFYQETKIFISTVNNDLLFKYYSTGINTKFLLKNPELGERIFGLQGKSQDEFTQIAQDIAIDILNTNLKLK
jgi:hypothetical protein